jgi:hypothetical protein
MHPHRGVQLGVCRGHHGGHGSARGEPGDEHPRGVGAVLGDDPAGETGQDRRLTCLGALVGRREPVPVAALVGCLGLLGVGHEQPVVLGELVHPGAGGEVGGVLRPAVQHYDER